MDIILSNMDIKMTEYLTVKEVAKILRVSIATIHRMINEGTIPYTKVNGMSTKLVKKDLLIKLLKNGTHDPLSKRL